MDTHGNYDRLQGEVFHLNNAVSYTQYNYKNAIWKIATYKVFLTKRDGCYKTHCAFPLRCFTKAHKLLLLSNSFSFWQRVHINSYFFISAPLFVPCFLLLLSFLQSFYFSLSIPFHFIFLCLSQFLGFTLSSSFSLLVFSPLFYPYFTLYSISVYVLFLLAFLLYFFLHLPPHSFPSTLLSFYSLWYLHSSVSPSKDYLNCIHIYIYIYIYMKSR
jgi:hypothetical protein